MRMRDGDGSAHWVHSCWPRKSMDGRRKWAHSGRLGAMKAAPEVVSEYGASTFARPRLAEGDDAKNYRFATGAQICCCTKTLCTTGLVTPWLSPNVPESTQETSNHWNVRWMCGQRQHVHRRSDHLFLLRPQSAMVAGMLGSFLRANLRQWKRLPSLFDITIIRPCRKILAVTEDHAAW